MEHTVEHIFRDTGYTGPESGSGDSKRLIHIPYLVMYGEKRKGRSANRDRTLLAGGQKLISAMTDMVTQKGAKILGSFHCRGKFISVNPSHPDKEDLDNAKKFAGEMLTTG